MAITAVLAAHLGTSTTNAGEQLRSVYDAKTRMLHVTTAAERQFKYVFNKGGAICEVYDLDIGPKTNLVGESFQGETTDRVIQWTYWNSRYLGAAHDAGSRDRRANVTMEGCFGDAHTCDVLATPSSGQTTTLIFRSRIRHWFFAELDRHGQPDFETTSRYDVLADGSLKLTRSVVRRPWQLRNVVVKTWDGKRWQESQPQDTELIADYQRPGACTSYFEAWTPLRRTALPRQRHGRGQFAKDGYRFWKPAELGGWAMAYGDKLAMAVVFGNSEPAGAKNKMRVSFNKLDLPQHRLNVLLPAIETDWPAHATLTQTLLFVVGEPEDVAKRAEKFVATIPHPVMRERTIRPTN